MTGEISKIAKYTFLVEFIITLVFGAFWFLAPELWNSLTGWPNEVASGRIVGMATLVMAIGSFLAYYRATSWEQVEIFVIMGLIYNVLGTVGMIWSVQTMTTLPVVSWVLIGLTAVFSVLFFCVFYMGRKK